MREHAILDNRITLQKLEVFCAVVNYGGVGKAATALFMTQSVVSAHLRSLQERMGLNLLERDGRNVRLTAAGRSVFLWASQVLRGRADLAKELVGHADGVAGSVTIGAGIAVGNHLLPDLLVDFRFKYSGANITVYNSSVETALQGVKEGSLDYCFVATYQTLDAATFDSRLVGRPKYTLIAAPDAPIPDRIDVADLATLQFICPPRGSRIRASQDFALSTIGVTDRHVVMELGSSESIKRAVARNLGVALIWRVTVEREINEGNFREIAIEGYSLHDNLFCVQPRGTLLTPFQLRVRDALVEGVGRRLARTT